jgi:Tfp pilus assembly protein PilN
MLTRTATGIELDDSGQVRLVELTSGVGGVAIRRAGRYTGAGSDLFQQWAAALNEASADGFTLQRAVIGLPSSLIFKKTLAFPFRGRKRISQILLSQLEGEIPLTAGEAVADFITLSAENEGCSGIAVVCRQQTIRGVLGILPQGSSPVAIQTEAVGLAAAASFGGLGDGTAIFCGTRGAVVAGLSAGKPTSFRRISYAENTGEGISRTVDSVLDLAPEKGETLIACEENREQLAGSLEERGIMSFQDPGTWSVFRSFEGTLDSDAALYLPALGLALKGIGHRSSVVFDLRQGPFAPVNPLGELKVPAARTAVLVILIILLGMVSLFNGLNRTRAEYDRYADSLRSSFAALFPDTKIVSEVAQIQERITQLERRNSSLKDFSGTGSLAVLEELSRRVPKEIQLQMNELAFDSGRLRIEGTVSSFDSVDRIKEALEASELFNDVRVQNARVGADASKVSFRLQMEVI